MASSTIEERVSALETEIAKLKAERLQVGEASKPWWETIRGVFKDDPDYVEAMRLGREYRVSLRPSDYTECD